MSNLFSEINLMSYDGPEVTSPVPLIEIIGARIIDNYFLQDGDYFLLEKYEVPKSDQESISMIDYILADQTIMHYMQTPVKNSWRPHTIYHSGDLVHYIELGGNDPEFGSINNPHGTMYVTLEDHISSSIDRRTGTPGFRLDYNDGKWEATGEIPEIYDYIIDPPDLWERDTYYGSGEIRRMPDESDYIGIYESQMEHYSSAIQNEEIAFATDLDEGKWQLHHDQSGYKEVIIQEEGRKTVNRFIYMSETLYMSEHAIPYEPTYFDITRNFRGYDERSLILDEETNIDDNMYIYRIRIRYQGIDYASSYVAGISYIPFGTIDEERIELGDNLIIEGNRTRSRASVLSRDLQRRSTNDIISKGLPIYNPVPRYEGPFEKDKQFSFLRDISNIYQWIDNCLDIIDSYSDSKYEELIKTHEYKV